MVQRVVETAGRMPRIPAGSYLFQGNRQLCAIVKWEPEHPDVKLNLKRARVGGPIVLHQDYPYWTETAQDAGEIATAILFLDDADRGNGGLEVLPGSHRNGVWSGKDAPTRCCSGSLPRTRGASCSTTATKG